MAARNYAKMIFACNELPPIKNNSDAFWLRWIRIKFPHQFLPAKELINNPEAKIQDPEIINKLTSPEELNGILTWSVEGLTRLEKNKDFSAKKTGDTTKSEWLRDSNSVSAFITDHIEEDYDSKIEKKEFKTRYLKYCKEHKIKILSDRVIKITLEQDVGAITRYDQPWVDGQQIKISYWEGIKFQNKDNKDRKDSVFTTYSKNLISHIVAKHPIFPIFPIFFNEKNTKKVEKSLISEEFIGYDDSQGLEVDVSSLGASTTNPLINFISEGRKHFTEIVDFIGEEKEAINLLNKLKLTGTIYETKKEYYEILK